MKKIKKVLSTLGAFGAIFGVCCTIQSAGAMQYKIPCDKVLFVGASNSDKSQVFKQVGGEDYVKAHEDILLNSIPFPIPIRKTITDPSGDKVILELHEASSQMIEFAMSQTPPCLDALKRYTEENYNTYVLVYDASKEAPPQEKYLKWWIDQIKNYDSIILAESNFDALDMCTIYELLEEMANNLGIEEKNRVLASGTTGENIHMLEKMLAERAFNRPRPYRIQENSEVKNLTDSQNKKSGCLLL